MKSQEIFASIQLNLGLQALTLMGNSRVPDMAVILNSPFLAKVESGLLQIDPAHWWNFSQTFFENIKTKK